MKRRLWVSVAIAGACAAAVARVDIRPVVETEQVAHDVDDPAIWMHPTDRARSLIVGTVKRPKPDGGLAVYNLDGNLLEQYSGIDRPNNVDILGDICVTTERLARQLRVYRVSESKPRLQLLGTVPVFVGEAGESAAPMGIALYKRASDKALFAMVSRKQGPATGYLWQYRLRVAAGSVTGEKVRAFGKFSGNTEIEAVAVDQERELVYYADEECCVRAYRADPDAPHAEIEVARFAETGFRANREGIAIAGPYVMVTDQLAPASEYHVYRRTDWQEVAVWRGVSDSTDGLDAIGLAMGPKFPKGFLIAMNSGRRTFHLYPLP
ncbi:MAG: phytase [Candidatus Solibacter sp.]